MTPLNLSVSRWLEAIRLACYLSAFAAAFYGNMIFVSGGADNRTEANQLARGLPFLGIGFLVWLTAELCPLVFRHFRPGTAAPSPPDLEVSGSADDMIEGDPKAAPQLARRIAFGCGSVIFAGMTWFATSGNTFRLPGICTWAASIVLIVSALRPAGSATASDPIRRPPGLSAAASRRKSLLALLAIVLLGAGFRFTSFSNMPPEMTIDHIEKLLDAQRVLDGTYPVYFANNGGREPFQMYAMALLGGVLGLGMKFESLKLLSVIEGLATLPLLWWLGREIFDDGRSELSASVSLGLAGLVAVSYWHTALSRLALRIVLTPLVATLLLIFFARALRRNRREDFIICGLVLGFGLYTYQAVRMLPVVIVIGVLLAMLTGPRSAGKYRQYAANLIVLVAVAFVIFVPLLRFWNQYPESFWERTAGRLLGEGVVIEMDSQGNLLERNATIQERLSALRSNITLLGHNLRNALLMFNWKGDVAWINGAPNWPAMDAFTGALLVIGLAAWVGLSLRTRDPVILLIPVMALVMLLPSALAIARPLENPSATRASGALPAVYLIAALPLGLISLSLRRVVGQRPGGLIGAYMLVFVLLGAYAMNDRRYFVEYSQAYRASVFPYSEAGQILRGFVQSGSSYANAFVIASADWWDHRAVGIEAGILDWTNGIAVREEAPDFIYDVWRCRDNIRLLDPDSDLLFFYHRDDRESGRLLAEWFPSGRAVLINSYLDQREFWIYRVPALGDGGMQQFADRFTRYRRC